MEAKLIINEHPEGRLLVSIDISLAPEEETLAKNLGGLAYADSPKPFPTQTYLCASPTMKMTVGMPKWNGVPQKAYFLSNARRVLLNRGIAGKTHLRIPVPGTLELGFVSPNEEKRITSWWKETKEGIAAELKEKLYGIKTSGVASSSAAVKTRSVGEVSVNLNPLDPNEKNGVRRRCLDDEL